MFCEQFAVVYFGRRGLLDLRSTLFKPGSEGGRGVEVDGLLHPLDHLGHRGEVDLVRVRLLDPVDPLEERVQEIRIVLQPGSVERKVEGRTVLIEVAVEVVDQEVVKLVSIQDVGAGVDN